MRPLFLALAAACHAPPPAPVPMPPEPANAGFEEAGPPMPFASPEALTTVMAPCVTESSGVAPSRRYPGTFWTLNDSGNAAEVVRFDLQGHLLGRHVVPGVENRDWEDLASGTCPGSADPCLYVGEIGDNKKRYPWIAVHAVREPGHGEPAERVATWRARYPDEAQNAETLLRDPGSGRLYVVTKRTDGRSEVLRFPDAPSEEPGVLAPVAPLLLEGEHDEFRQATGGAWSADGRRVVVRTYVVAWEWDVDPERPEAFWSEPPRRAWLAPEERGEAVAYLPDGALLTTSEGFPMPVNRVPRGVR